MICLTLTQWILGWAFKKNKKDVKDEDPKFTYTDVGNGFKYLFHKQKPFDFPTLLILSALPPFLRKPSLHSTESAEN